MDQICDVDRSFSVLLTVQNGKVADDLCVVLPQEQYVTYEPSDLVWLIPLGMTECIRLPEPLVAEIANTVSRSLFDTIEGVRTDLSQFGFEATPEESPESPTDP